FPRERGLPRPIGARDHKTHGRSLLPGNHAWKIVHPACRNRTRRTTPAPPKTPTAECMAAGKQKAPPVARWGFCVYRDATIEKRPIFLRRDLRQRVVLRLEARRAAVQPGIDRTRALAAFGERPHHQRLAAAHV